MLRQVMEVIPRLQVRCSSLPSSVSDSGTTSRRHCWRWCAAA